MAEYIIEAVAKDTRTYDSKYGKMISYKVKLPGVNDPVEVSQKESTPAPKPGDVLKGTIEGSNFGPKFKKEFTPKAGGGGGGGGRETDPFTMYLSYAKDIAIALTVDGKLDKAAYAEILADVSAGGMVLYESRPNASPAPQNELKQPDNASDEGDTDKHDPFEGMDLDLDEANKWGIDD